MKTFSFLVSVLVGSSLLASAKGKETEERIPAATVQKRNGVICSEDTSLHGAESRLNAKLGGSETVISLGEKYGSIAEAKITSMNVNVIPDKKAASGYTYVMCASVNGSEAK